MYLCVSGIDFASSCYFIFNIVIYFIQGSLTCPGVALASENEKKKSTQASLIYICFNILKVTHPQSPPPEIISGHKQNKRPTNFYVKWIDYSYAVEECTYPDVAL